MYTDAGEDLIASSASGYAANVEKATSKLAADRGPGGRPAMGCRSWCTRRGRRPLTR